MGNTRDHGGNLDAQIARFGGTRESWIDLSTGINPVPYPIGELPAQSWSALPDEGAQRRLIEAARRFWNVPDHLDILAAPGASAIIARLPFILHGHSVAIPQPTYNEHAAAFTSSGWSIGDDADVRVLVHPNNPTGKLWTAEDLTAPITIIDESFCDVAPEASLIETKSKNHTIILKSFGKFWGLAGLRLGFLIGAPKDVEKMNTLIGPWAVSGSALEIGTSALSDFDWATQTRSRLERDSERLDGLMVSQGAKLTGGCTLFRLYDVPNAKEVQLQLAKQHVWTRIFPYSETLIRLGLPAPNQWHQLGQAMTKVTL